MANLRRAPKEGLSASQGSKATSTASVSRLATAEWSLQLEGMEGFTLPQNVTIPVGTDSAGFPILLSSISQIEAHNQPHYAQYEDFGATGSALLGVTNEIFRSDFEELIEMTQAVKASRDQTRNAVQALFKVVGSKPRGRTLVKDLLELKCSKKVYRLVARIAKRSALISEVVLRLNNAIIDNLREVHPQGSGVFKNISPREAEKADAKAADSSELFLLESLSPKGMAEWTMGYTSCGLSHRGPLLEFPPFEDEAEERRTCEKRGSRGVSFRGDWRLLRRLSLA
ncbi:uncharacterized protein PAC_15137 [Phialocephala subalpina]|uniref:Uncharacterized protein n=1 Tax=Phialocephala subalpina TaxID=576137 RepID=A0A1L7XJV3_9HELO|nr:uncharacterized protein PAC_15137 [Phialocephala subalpina]